MRTRPTAFEIDHDRRLEHALFALVRKGVPVVTAARELGVPERTVLRWVQRGRAGMPRYRRFLDGVEAARAEHAYDVAQLVADARERGAARGSYPQNSTGR